MPLGPSPALNAPTHDTTLGKPNTRTIAIVSRHWTGKHKAVVRGINLVTAVGYVGGRILPAADRVDPSQSGRPQGRP